MASLPLAEAKARFSALINRVEAGETVEITRRGRSVAKLIPAEHSLEKPNWASLKALHAMQEQQEDSGEFIRRMREAGY